jgi:hypothetical protein
MSNKEIEPSKKGFPIFLLALAVLAVVGAGLYFWLGASGERAETKTASGPAAAPTADEKPGIVRKPVPVQVQNVVNVDALAGDQALQETMRDRKEQYGIGDSVDAILKPDESLKLGDSTVPMREILEKIRIKRGEIVEDVLSDRSAEGTSGERIGPPGSLPADHDVFGIYVVKRNDNIWNIHFAFLKDCFENKGIRISSKADEPDDSGFSSGVGKLLKFSEKIVYIYNLRERKLDVDLNLISPATKIVVFHMGEIFALLDELDLSNVDRIQFDGENIWIPAADS